MCGSNWKEDSDGRDKVSERTCKMVVWLMVNINKRREEKGGRNRNGPGGKRWKAAV